MKKNITLSFFLALFLTFFTVAASPAQASLTSDIQTGLDNIQTSIGLPGTFSNLPSAISTIFSVVISLSAGIFIIILLIGGLSYLVSASSDEGVAKAKRMMINAIIGLVITLAAWAIGLFILGQVGYTGLPGGGGGGGSGGNEGGGGGNLQQYNVRFFVVSQRNQPIPLAEISIDGAVKGQTSTNGAIIITITNPKPAGSTYSIKVTPAPAGTLDPSQPNCNEKTGQYTLDRGTIAEPSRLTIKLDCE